MGQIWIMKILKRRQLDLRGALLRKLFLALSAVTLLSAISLSSHQAKTTVIVAPNGIQATSLIQTIACHMRQVCTAKPRRSHFQIKQSIHVVVVSLSGGYRGT